MRYSTRELVSLSVFGTLWGAIEIVPGSVLHATGLPLSGVVMASAGLFVALVARRFTCRPGSVLFVGALAALLKLFSVGSIVIGPMIGILAEAGMAELGLFLTGRASPLSFVVAGALGVCWTALHPFVTGFVLFGRDILTIWNALIEGTSRALGIEAGQAALWGVAAWVCVRSAAGAVSGWTAWRAGGLLLTRVYGAERSGQERDGAGTATCAAAGRTSRRGIRPEPSEGKGAGRRQEPCLVGTLGHLAVFAWVVVLTVAAPSGRSDVACGLCLTALLIGYPAAAGRLFWLAGRVRLWLPVLLTCIALFPVLLFSFGGGDPGFAAGGLTGAVFSGLRLAARALVLVLAVEAVTSSVDIAQIAGILERLGFRGLGFSLGVGTNLLPSLHRSWVCARESLWMRGGFRAARWRALKLLFVTVVGNTLSRSREIAVAAECRAYDPEGSRPAPLRRGRADRWLWLLCLGSLLWVLLYP